MLLLELIKNQGIPLAIYSDRHGIFQRSPKEPETLEEQLEGERQPTQFGRALIELNIQPIFALSPQAKGRIERLWGTFQDRLVSELRLAGAKTLEEANKVLWNFLPRFNARFGVPASVPGSAYRCLEPGVCLDAVLSFKYRRTVAGDNTIHFNGHTLQLLPGLDRFSYAHTRVELQERLDGSWVVYYQGQIITIREAPPQPVTLRARKGARAAPVTTPSRLVVGSSHDNIAIQGSNMIGPDTVHEETQENSGQNKCLMPASIKSKPSPDHPWRKMLLTKSLNI